MEQANIISLIAQLLPVQTKVETPDVKQCRKYASHLTLDVTLRGRTQSVPIPINYEIENAFSWLTQGGEFKAHDFMLHIRHGPHVNNDRHPTCELARNALSQLKPKHALVPSWEHYNFDGLVCVLGGMLSVLTMHPQLTTYDFRNKKPYIIKGINQMSDLTTIMDEGNVYLDPRFTLGQNNNVMWTIATAANMAGARVIIPYADTDADGRVICREVGGAQLINGISTALNLLGTYYSLSNLGDVFSLALTRGIHRTVSVVGQSDEGGIVRDLLRVGSYAPPFGGLPQGLSASSGMPIIDGHYYEELCAVADSILLLTAALVAHCDPMVEVEGDYFPTVITVADEEVAATGGVASTDRAKALADRFCANMQQFAVNYCRGLSKLFNLQCDYAEPKAASYLIQAASWLRDNPTRHFEAGPVLLPYFWIEPTTILPKRFLGTAAEEHGSGSLAGWDDKPITELFPGATALGPTDTYQSDWAINFKSARTVPFILYALNHWKDGLANMLMKGFDTGRLALSRLSTEEILRNKEHDGYVNPGQLLWVRGQSKIPHPGEVLNLDGRLSMSFVHCIITPQGHTRPVAHLPRSEEIHEAKVRLIPSKIRYWETGKANNENNDVRRQRTRGVKALEEAQYQVLKVVKMIGPGAQASERPPPKLTAHAPSAPVNDTVLCPPIPTKTPDAKPAVTPDTGKSVETKSEPVAIARQHGALLAPKPGESQDNAGAQAADGGQAVAPPGKPNTGDGNGAANQQAAAPAQAGAAPAKC